MTKSVPRSKKKEAKPKLNLLPNKNHVRSQAKIPEWVAPGRVVNAHPEQHKPPTILRARIASEPELVDRVWCVRLEGQFAPVSIGLLTLCEPNPAKSTASLYRQLRLDLWLRQTEMAELLDVSQSALSKMESGLLEGDALVFARAFALARKHSLAAEARFQEFIEEVGKGERA